MHERVICEEGHVIRQCRCIGPKTETVVLHSENCRTIEQDLDALVYPHFETVLRGVIQGIVNTAGPVCTYRFVNRALHRILDRLYVEAVQAASLDELPLIRKPCEKDGPVDGR